MVLLLVCGGVITVGAGTAVAVSTAESPDGNAVATPQPAVHDQPTAYAMTPDRHVDPDQYEEDGDLSEATVELAQDLADRHQEWIDAIDDGRYDAVVDQPGDAYDATYREYESVVADRGGYDQEHTEEPLPEAFAVAADEQAKLAAAVAAYEDRFTEYQTATDRGDEDAALAHARELDRHAAVAGETAETLAAQFEAMESVAGADLDTAPATLETVADDLETRHDAVQAAVFANTSIAADAAEEVATPAEPVEITGTLAVDGGWESDAETVTLAVEDDDQTLSVVSNRQTASIDETDDGVIDRDGQFTLEYRPDPLTTPTETITLAYQPEPGVAHRPVETELATAIEAARPSVSFNATQRASFRENVFVAGELTVDDEPVDGASIRISVDDEELTTVTSEDGQLEADPRLPVTVPDGDRELTLTVDDDAVALESVSATESITVVERESRLSVSATEPSPGTLAVNGTLTTLQDRSVPDQPIELRIDGEPAATVSTERDGSFGETLEVDGSGNATVHARYAGEGSNLASAESTTTVHTSSVGWLDRWDRALAPLAGVILFLVALVGVWRLARYVRDRRTTSSRDTPDEDTTTPAAVDADAIDRLSEPADRPTEESAEDPYLAVLTDAHAAELLEDANRQLDAGRPNEAIRSAYAAARVELQSFGPADASLTHWEFVDRYDGPHADRLTDLTTQYERATFGVDECDTETATDAVVSAEYLVQGLSDQTPGHESTADDQSQPVEH